MIPYGDDENKLCDQILELSERIATVYRIMRGRKTGGYVDVFTKASSAAHSMNFWIERLKAAATPEEQTFALNRTRMEYEALSKYIDEAEVRLLNSGL